ncbi:MAG: phytanoyl-CoA dioxygenase family protein [Anaerolineae bacterium]|nr:phytanoyl-CoA dioxygenase family protein [Anaerolineae bacterium]
MSDKQLFVYSHQMAAFVARGFLRFDEIVPDEINQAAMSAFEAGGIQSYPAGTPLGECYPEPSPIGAMLRLPQIQGILDSLVGPDPLFDHHANHKRLPNEGKGQGLHGDSIIDTRLHFDLQLRYFPHALPLEMGGTLLLPGSHFRRINEMEVARYQNFLGQIPMVCKAGSILVLHHGIWHCGRQNQTDRLRYMYKIRLNPTVRQLRLWNTDDLDDDSSAHQPIFAGEKRHDVQAILAKLEPWYEAGDGRLEIVNRTLLWRFLTGDEDFDVHYWLTRLENMPENRLSA